MISGIGLSLFVAELTGVYFTGGSLNPARSFGPAALNHSFPGYHWIYWLGPVLGSIVAAGFYKFIKVLEYETANPDQDQDHAAKVRRRKNLLMQAGINEADAHHVAEELTETSAVSEKGGPDGSVVANGQGRKSHDVDRDGMYGTNFRASSTSTEHTAVPIEQPTRPVAVTTASQTGRYGYLGSKGVGPQLTRAASRKDSPAMATHTDVYASHNAPDEALGGTLNEPRNRFARTASSGV